MRVPIAGGPSQEILVAKNLVHSSCARSASSTCVIAERTEDQKQVVITIFDLLKGRGSELTSARLEVRSARLMVFFRKAINSIFPGTRHIRCRIQRFTA